jgi:toxin FitB
MGRSFYGLERMPVGKRCERLTEITRNILEVEFRGRVLPFDEAAAHHYAPILAARRKKGAPMSAFDAQIAAIALANGASLATRNVMDFEDCGVNLIDPWKAKA